MYIRFVEFLCNSDLIQKIFPISFGSLKDGIDSTI